MVQVSEHWKVIKTVLATGFSTQQMNQKPERLQSKQNFLYWGKLTKTILFHLLF